MQIDQRKLQMEYRIIPWQIESSISKTQPRFPERFAQTSTRTNFNELDFKLKEKGEEVVEKREME